jgi:DNA-binding NtrC family response regulator
VDDEAGLREAFARYLRSVHYQVAQASDGAEALDLLRMSQFDLVITDVRMPKVDGITLARWIQEKRPTTPVILISGQPPNEADDVLSRQEVEFIQKPLRPEDLVLGIQRLLHSTAPQ